MIASATPSGDATGDRHEHERELIPAAVGGRDDQAALQAGRVHATRASDGSPRRPDRRRPDRGSAGRRRDARCRTGSPPGGRASPLRRSPRPGRRSADRPARWACCVGAGTRAVAAPMDWVVRPRLAFNRRTGSAAASTVADGRSRLAAAQCASACAARGAAPLSDRFGGRARAWRPSNADSSAGWPVQDDACARLGAFGPRRGALPSMTVSGPWVRTSSCGATSATRRAGSVTRATGSRTSSPHHGHSVNQPSVGAAQLQQRPGGATLQKRQGCRSENRAEDGPRPRFSAAPDSKHRGRGCEPDEPCRDDGHDQEIDALVPQSAGLANTGSLSVVAARPIRYGIRLTVAPGTSVSLTRCTGPICVLPGTPSRAT